MLDIHPVWLAVLLVNFLGLIFVLNIILFKPFLKILKEREDTIKGSLEAAKEMNSRKEEGIATLNREIAGARAQARDIFEDMKTEGLTMQKEVLGTAEATASEMLQKAREELRGEVVKAKDTLKADVEKFSDEIVRKLVKA